MTAFMVSLAGVPPTGGFWAKLLIFQAGDRARRDRRRGSPSIMVINSVISVGYYFAIPRAMIFEDAEDETPFRSPILVTAVVAVAMAALLVIFVVPNAIYRLGRGHVARLRRLNRTFAAVALYPRGRGDRSMTPGINRLKTWILIAALGGLFVVIGSIWGVQGAVLGLAIALVFNVAMYWLSGSIAVAHHPLEARDRAGVPRSSTGSSGSSPPRTICRCPRSTSRT